MTIDCEHVARTIVIGIKSKTDVAIIGMSGGADSTLVAILCKEALGAGNVFAVHMPYGETDERTFNLVSKKIANVLGVEQITVPIAKISDGISDCVLESLMKYNENLFESEKSIGIVNNANSRSRSRMCVLYGICHFLQSCSDKRVRVIGTGNFSEDYIGYGTKGGDTLADLFPIGDMFKSEVYQLLDYYRDAGLIDEEHIDRVPSAGLWEGQTDEMEIGYSYNEMEKAIRLIDKWEQWDEGSGITDKLAEVNPVADFVLKMRDASRHKKGSPEVICLRRNDN